jgi:hypothetical protein
VTHTVTIVHCASQRVVARTPFAITVTSDGVSSGVFSPAKSVVEGDGLFTAVAGRTARFVVRSRDADRHALQSGGLRLAVKVAGPVTVEPRVTDNGDGSYAVEYQTPRAGQYVVACARLTRCTRRSARRTRTRCACSTGSRRKRRCSSAPSARCSPSRS